MDKTAYAKEDEKRDYHILKVLFRKETAEFINSKRMFLFVVLTALITVSGFYAAVSGLAESIKNGNTATDFLFLKLFTVSANSIPSYNSLMALMGPFIGIFMGFDAINSERTEGTLSRLMSQPLYRDQIIISKFLAGLFISAVMVIATGLLIASAGLIFTGLIPSGEEICRLLIYLCFCIIYICFWLAMMNEMGNYSCNLTLGQSLLLIWPHLTGLLALMLIVFTNSYISFMQQEIRPR